MTNHFVKISNHFFSADLYNGKIELYPNHSAIYFFIVEHPADKAFMQKQALQLLIDDRCKDFLFYGNYRNEWEFAFDESDVLLHPNDNDFDIATTSTFDSIESFIEQLDIALHTRSFIPCDVFLIYDDHDIYTKIIQALEASTMQS